MARVSPSDANAEDTKVQCIYPKRPCVLRLS